MATISTSSGSHGGRKPLAVDVPLVPFLDLLLCCVMFLLVTAVWNELAAVQATQRVPAPGMDVPDVPLDIRLTLSVRGSGYELSSTTGERQWLEGHDAEALHRALAAQRAVRAGVYPLTIASEDGVSYAMLIHAMDVALAAGYSALDVASTER